MKLTDEFAGVPMQVDAPCGVPAYFDRSSGCGYRCSLCFAVLGSVGIPRACEEAGRAALEQEGK